MQPDNYLHEQKDFRDLIQVVSGERRILPQLIEKDYWIMHVLNRKTLIVCNMGVGRVEELTAQFGVAFSFSPFGELDCEAVKPEWKHYEKRRK